MNASHAKIATHETPIFPDKLDRIVPRVGADNVDRLLCGVERGPELSNSPQTESVNRNAWGRANEQNLQH